jgi:hypothetical protein
MDCIYDLPEGEMVFVKPSANGDVQGFKEELDSLVAGKSWQLLFQEVDKC